MRKFTCLFLLFLATFTTGHTQNPADSVRLCDPAQWRVLTRAEGMVCRQFRCELFGVPQKIWVAEMAPAQYRIGIEQFTELTRVSRTASASNVAVAVNGGFYRTDTEQAIPIHYLRTKGVPRSPESVPLRRGDAVLAVDNRGVPRLLNWSEETEPLSGSYPDMIAAGPMVLYNGAARLEWQEIEKKNLGKQQIKELFAPRTAFGIKPDGTLMMIVVDGRRNRAYGMSFAELAVLGRWLGLESMINLDGGGSSTLWIKGRGVVNQPSDGKSFIHIERKVANMVFAVPR